jgi:ArsR family metal-binding transcriptional regulator
MAVYHLLPGGDCKKCGEPTCWNFALKLAAGQKRTAECPELSEPRYASNLAELRETVL